MVSSRRRFWGNGACAILVVLLGCLCNAPAGAFGFGDVEQRARELAGTPYQRPDPKLPQELADLGYDRYRDIRFKPDHAFWRKEKLPFELEFFHEGLYYNLPVKLNEVGSQGAKDVSKEIRFNPADFDYGANKLDLNKLKDLGFAGFRVHFAVNTPKYKDEVLVFLGASYFKALGREQRYGLSARGLAIDTGLISGEEFPRFTEFWIERPKPGDKELTIYGLLDSRRVAGAYRFVLRPGDETQVEVKERLFLRENVSKLGLTPLTSMFFFGENQPAQSEDYRPEVHDSDGLSIHSGTGEWLWRPLVNPKRLLVTSFAMTNPLGFGLMQRDHAFRAYEDLEARYDLRPSAWVEPQGQWGPGRVELVNIPSPDETNDNAASYWVPDNPPSPEQPLDLEYILHWQSLKDTLPPLSWVSQTRRGRAPGAAADSNNLQFVIDFEGPALQALPSDAHVEGIVSVGANGELLERNTYYNEVTGGWRLTLRLHRIDDDKPLELRAYLRSESSTLSETWSYILPPG
jgi:glucans biosynthesis protein